MYLSIIIPAFNESAKIENDLIEADSYLQKNSPDGEIIVVDDGSTDSTADIVRRKPIELDSKITLHQNPKNLGKGAAVKNGVSKSKGKYILYTDAGGIVPFDSAKIGLDLLEHKNYHIANGSRKLKDSKIIKEQDWDRKLIAKVFHFTNKFLFQLPKHLTDTQCGFKLYNGNAARELFPKLITEGFLFEIEIILLALKYDYKITEFPVIWRCDRDSRLSVSKSGRKIIEDILNILKSYF